MKCFRMLFTLTTGEEHIMRLTLSLNTAEFLTDVQTVLITVLLLNLLFRLPYNWKIGVLKNWLILITVLIAVVLSVLLFGLFTVQFKNWDVYSIIGLLLFTISFFYFFLPEMIVYTVFFKGSKVKMFIVNTMFNKFFQSSTGYF